MKPVLEIWPRPHITEDDSKEIVETRKKIDEAKDGSSVRVPETATHGSEDRNL